MAISSFIRFTRSQWHGRLRETIHFQLMRWSIMRAHIRLRRLAVQHEHRTWAYTRIRRSEGTRNVSLTSSSHILQPAGIYRLADVNYSPLTSSRSPSSIHWQLCIQVVPSNYTHTQTHTHIYKHARTSYSGITSVCSKLKSHLIWAAVCAVCVFCVYVCRLHKPQNKCYNFDTNTNTQTPIHRSYSYRDVFGRPPSWNRKQVPHTAADVVVLHAAAAAATRTKRL